MKYSNRKPKHFLGASLAVGQLGFSAYNAIGQHRANKRMIAQQNKIIAENEEAQLYERNAADATAQANYGLNSNSKSFYAKGGRISGLRPITNSEAIVYGPTHNESNPKQGGTGVSVGDVELEGGGKDGNQPGEVLRQKDGESFVFSDRILADDKHTFAQIAQAITLQKGELTRKAESISKDMLKYQNDMKQSGSAVDASTIGRKYDKSKIDHTAVQQSIEALDGHLQQLQQLQLQKGISLGVYNEDGTPKDTTNVPADGQTVESQNQEQMAYGGRPRLATGGFDKFMSSANGQAATGLLQTGINLASNIMTAKAMSKLKTPKHIAMKSIDMEKANYSADKEAIKQNVEDTSQFAKDNYSNPNVALAIKQNAVIQSEKQLASVTQAEQNANHQIEYQNAQNRLAVTQQNDANYFADEMAALGKAQQDISNRQAITAGLSKDLGQVQTNYLEGKKDERIMNMYERSYSPGVSTRTNIAGSYGQDVLNSLESAKDQDSLTKLFDEHGITPADREAYLKTRFFRSTPASSVSTPASSVSTPQDPTYRVPNFFPKAANYFGTSGSDTLDMLSKFRKPIIYK